MKKRITAILMAAVIIVSLVPYAMSAEGICFIGVNDSVPMYLPDGHAPFYKGNILYIPYTVFNAGAGGIAVSYNPDKGSLALFTRAKRLVYDLNSGTVTDEATKVGKVDVVYRNGMLFIPASKAISHFGLSSTMLTSTSGNQVLRITDGSQQLENGLFIRKAETLISIILEQELEDQGNQQGGVGTLDENPVTASGPATIYIAFAGDAVNELTLQELKQQGIYAAFFLTKQQIEENPELIRNIYASGHVLGLTVDTNTDNYEAALSEANAALDRVLFAKSLMVLLSNGGEELQQYSVFRDWGMKDVEGALKISDREQLIVCRFNAQSLIQSICQADAKTPRLTETTIIPGVTVN